MLIKDFEKTLEKSKEVFRNCSLPNGAIIASDVNNPLYPKNVKWYGYVWLRDEYNTAIKVLKWVLEK
jgi:hypothetical protein